MKKMKIASISILLLILPFFTSCSSDDDATNLPSGGTFIRYTVDGVNYEYSNIATAQSAGNTINGEIGDPGDANYTFISIWLPLDLQTGTFTFSGDVFQDGDYKLNLESNPLNITDEWAVSGNVTLETINADVIAGTFTATIFDDDGNSITLENGEFDAVNVD
jgi:hypothetical protein